MIFEQVDNKDLCNMRLTCRQMVVETNEEFGRRFLKKIKILGKVSKVKQLHDILRLPIMAQNKLKIRELCVDYPTAKDLAVEHGVVVEDWLPSEELARHLLNAIPDLKEFALHDPDDGEESQFGCEHEVSEENQAIAQIFLSALGNLKPRASNLTRLILDTISFDGLDLHGVLSAHSSTLRILRLVSCELTGDQIDPVTWDRLFHKLHEMKLDDLFMSGLYDSSAEKALVLHEHSFSDLKKDNWSSINPRHKAPPVDWRGTRHHFSDYEKADVPGSVAIFSRWQGHLRHSWVKRGLDFMLGKGDHTLYWDPRDFDEILESL